MIEETLLVVGPTEKILPDLPAFTVHCLDTKPVTGVTTIFTPVIPSKTSKRHGIALKRLHARPTFRLPMANVSIHIQSSQQGVYWKT